MISWRFTLLITVAAVGANFSCMCAYAGGLFMRWKGIAEFALCLSGLVFVWIVCFVPESPREYN